MNRVATFFGAARELGLSWVLWRSLYAVFLRTGGFRWAEGRDARSEDDLARAVGRDPERFRVELEAAIRGVGAKLPGAHRQPLSVATDADAIRARTAAIRSGLWRAYGWSDRALGWPPDWFAGEADRPRWPSNVHWSSIADLGSEHGDVKYVWEASRFTEIVTLVRAARLDDGVDRTQFAADFLDLAHDWIRNNPPYTGPNWRCGQETSLRVIMWLFAIGGLHCAELDAARTAALVPSLWTQARHVERVHWYATKCVRNNHAISEAVALFSVGALFPFLPRARHWIDLGRKSMTREMRWQIPPEGGYAQCSPNYGRLVLQLLLWTATLCREADIDEPEGLRDGVDRLTRWLHANLCPRTGRAPNLGPNDGAYLFPLSSSAHDDLRPTVAAGYRLLGRDPGFGIGGWDEESAWWGVLGSTSETYVTVELPRVHTFKTMGQVTVDAGDFGVRVRTGPIHFRPHQADLGHVDLWYAGANVLADAGTFSYAAEGDAGRWFSGTGAHGTVHVGTRDQLVRAGRFLWLHRPRVDGPDVVVDGSRVRFAIDVAGGWRHEREIAVAPERVEVIDTIEARGHEDVTLHWLIDECEVEMGETGEFVLRLESGRSLVLRIEADAPFESVSLRGSTLPFAGWCARLYGRKTAAMSLICTSTARRVRWVTTIRAEAGRGVASGSGEPSA